MHRSARALLSAALLLLLSAPVAAERATPYLDPLEKALTHRLDDLVAPVGKKQKRQAKTARKALARLGAETGSAAEDFALLKKLARPLARSFAADGELMEALAGAADAFESELLDIRARLRSARLGLPDVRLTRKADRSLRKADRQLERAAAQAAQHSRIARLARALAKLRKAEKLLARALGPPEPTRLVVSPESALLTRAGEAIALRAEVLDQLGRPLAVPVTWRSSAPQFAAVDAAGTVTAGEVGSARVAAEVGDLVSTTVIVSARPVPDAVLVADEQVASLPEPVDPLAPYGLGFAYTVLLEGVAPVPGDLLVGTGSLPVGGRVMAVAPGDPALVTLEIVSLETLFSELSVDESYEAGPEDFEVPAEVAGSYEATRSEDGSWSFVPREGSASQTARAARDAEGTVAQAVGPFSCSSSVAHPIGLDSPPTFRLQPRISVDFSYDSQEGLRRLVARGELTASASYRPRIQAAFTGSVGCKASLLGIRIPVPGPLAFVVGGYVPIGVGFEVEGTVTLAQFGIDAVAQTRLGAEVGVACSAGVCDPVQESDSEDQSRFQWVFPSFVEQFRVDLAARGYGYFELRIGNPFWQTLQLKMVEGRAGLQQTASLAPRLSQAEDTAYASSYEAALFARVGAGASLRDVLGLFSVSLAGFELATEIELARSPRGTFEFVDPAGAGETVRARVELGDVDYLGIPNVERVRIYRHDGALLVLRATAEPDSPGDPEIVASWEAEPGDLGASFVATVETELLPGLELEIAPDSHRTLGTGGVALVSRYHAAGGWIEQHEEPFTRITDLEELSEQVETLPSGITGPRQVGGSGSFGGASFAAQQDASVTIGSDGALSVAASITLQMIENEDYEALVGAETRIAFDALGPVPLRGSASPGLFVQLLEGDGGNVHCAGESGFGEPTTCDLVLPPGRYELRVSLFAPETGAVAGSFAFDVGP